MNSEVENSTGKQLHSSEDVYGKKWMRRVRKWVFAGTRGDTMKRYVCLFLLHRKHSSSCTHCCSTWPINVWRNISSASMCCASWNWTAPIHHLDTRQLTSTSHCSRPWRSAPVNQCSVVRPRALHLWGPNQWRLRFWLHKSQSRP